VGEAQADVEEAKMRVVQSVDQGVLLALAARDLARNVPRISNLTVTPDLVVPMLARLGESMGGGSREVVAGREEGDGGATGPGRR